MVVQFVLKLEQFVCKITSVRILFIGVKDVSNQLTHRYVGETESLCHFDVNSFSPRQCDTGRTTNNSKDSLNIERTETQAAPTRLPRLPPSCVIHTADDGNVWTDLPEHPTPPFCSRPPNAFTLKPHETGHGITRDY